MLLCIMSLFLQGSKRYNVVTLKGEVIDISGTNTALVIMVTVLVNVCCTGTMSGGGARVIKGRMSSKFRCEVSNDELQEMERSLERDSRQIETLREKHYALEDTVSQLKKSVTDMERDMDKYSAEIQVLMLIDVSIL